MVRLYCEMVGGTLPEICACAVDDLEASIPWSEMKVMQAEANADLIVEVGRATVRCIERWKVDGLPEYRSGSGS